MDNRKLKHRRRRLVIVLVVVIVTVVAAIVLCPLWMAGIISLQSVDEQFARIERERYIPDSENAALIYARLAGEQDPGAFSFEMFSGQSYSLIRSQLWRDKEYPELAKWLEGHKALMSELIRASSMEECRFGIVRPVATANTPTMGSQVMRQWSMVLAASASNDAAEGRFEQALEKYSTLIQMGRHMRQQPVALDFLPGIALEAMAFEAMRPAVLEARLTEEHLQAIESMLAPIEDCWASDSRTLVNVERLFELQIIKKQSLLKRLKAWWEYLRRGSPVINRTHEMYLRLLSDRRANHILIAVRRYKDRTGRWPESLDEIKPSVSKKEIFKDPTNGGQFVYKLLPTGPWLHSKGPDGKDEKGVRQSDDRIIWPIGRSPALPARSIGNAR